MEGEQINRLVQIIGHKDTFKVECAKILNEASRANLISVDFLLTAAKGRVCEDELIADATKAESEQEEDTICARELPAENPDRDHLDGDDNNCCADVIYILHASVSSCVPLLD